MAINVPETDDLGPTTDPTGPDLPETPEEWLAYFDELEQAEEDEAARASGGSGGPTRTSIDFTGDSTSIGKFRTDTNRNITETVRRYVDVPTAAEFLNDFETGTNTFLAGLRESGQISQFDMDLARSQMGSLLNDYLGELGLRASRGEDIFEVVGVSNEIFRLGTRPGEASQQQVTEAEKTTGKQTTTGSQTTGATADGEKSTTTQKSSETSKTDTTNQRTEDTTRQQTEEIFRRPNLTSVFRLAPAQFLQERFPDPGQLATVLRSRAGRGQAIATRGGSGVVSGARRA